MIITSAKEDRSSAKQENKALNGDQIDIVKFNNLPSPVTAVMYGGGKWWIETLDVQTGAMRLDVCGKIDLSHFSEVKELIDIDGFTHNPDDFWID